MLTLNFPRDNFDQDNTFAFGYASWKAAHGERLGTGYLFYANDEKKLYIMQKSACLKDHYTDKDREESARLQAQVPVRHGDVVEVEGAQYRVHLNGNYSDAGYLIPMEQPTGLFEAVLEGFDGGTHETDHLVKWGFADSLEQVKEFFPNAKVQPLSFKPADTDLDFDIRSKPL